MNDLNLKFENAFQSRLIGDHSQRSETRQTPGIHFALTKPTAVSNPEVLIWSEEAGALLDLATPTSPGGLVAEVFSGNKILTGMAPYAARYGGHQFGNWAGQLGDGRAISLGDIRNQKGERWEIQLKGAGPTPYSRRADGRAVLRSSLREFLCSEAMFHLGVPTTRALCLVTTGDQVLRDMFYDGHPEYEPGAITTRLSPSFIRFGNFEILAALGEIDNLAALTEFTMTEFFPHLPAKSEEGIIEFFREVTLRTARLMVDWLRVGFVHGVMNTDNMSILGLTIDYGPYGWLDVYDPGFTPNTTDAGQRRYRYAQQPTIALWNLARLAEALAPLIQNHDALEAIFDDYRSTFSQGFHNMMGQKLGLETFDATGDLALLESLDRALRSTEIDMTLFYRALADFRTGSKSELTPELQNAFYQTEVSAGHPLRDWLKLYGERCRGDSRSPAEVKAAMNAINPFVVPRNYQVQEALDALAVNDRKPLDQLMKAIKTPYEDNEATRSFAKKRPEWARKKPGCSDLSCSS
ncbi:MAG: YdiU family protein [Bdellovibrionota bacterium]